MRAKKYFMTLAVVYLAYLTHGIQAIVLSQNLDNLAAQWGVAADGVYQAIAYTGLAKFVTVWICGEISDKIGRKPMVLIGAVAYVIFFGGTLMTTNFTIACVCAFLAGAATSFFDGSLYAAAQESWIKAPGSATILIKFFISVSGLIYPMLVVQLRAAGGTAWKAGLILPIVMSIILFVVALIAPFSYDEEMKEKKAAGQAVGQKKGGLDADAQYAADRFLVPAPKWLVVPLAIMGFINMSCMYSAQQLLTRYGLNYVGMSDAAAAGLTSLYTGGSLAAVLIWAVAMSKLRWRTLKVIMIDLCGSIVFYALAVFTSSALIIQISAFAIGFFAAGGLLQCGVTLIQEFHPGPKGRNLGIYYTFMGANSYVMPYITAMFTRSAGGDDGIAARTSLSLNLVFAVIGLLFVLFLAANYKKWFGTSAFSKKGPDDIY